MKKLLLCFCLLIAIVQVCTAQSSVTYYEAAQKQWQSAATQWRAKGCTQAAQCADAQVAYYTRLISAHRSGNPNNAGDAPSANCQCDETKLSGSGQKNYDKTNSNYDNQYQRQQAVNNATSSAKMSQAIYGDDDNIGTQAANAAASVANSLGEIELGGYLDVAGSFFSVLNGQNRQKEAERQAAEEERKRIAAERQKIANRKTALQSLTTGSFPKGLNNFSTVYIYLLAWSGENSNKAKLYMSNPVEVQKYGDDTWPLFNEFVAKLEKYIPAKYEKKIVRAYFVTKEGILSEQETITQSLQGTDTEIQGFNIAYVSSNNSNPTKQQEDFWEDGSGKTKTKNANQNNEPKPQEQKNKRADSYWD